VRRYKEKGEKECEDMEEGGLVGLVIAGFWVIGT